MHAPVVVRVGVPTADLDRPGVVLDGAAVVALTPSGDAAVVVGDRVGSVELDRLRVIRDGPVEIPGFEPDVPAVHAGYSKRRVALLEAGVSLFELSRLMGTSPAMLDRTYGHMLPDALDRARNALDSFIAASNPEEATSV